MFCSNPNVCRKSKWSDFDPLWMPLYHQLMIALVTSKTICLPGNLINQGVYDEQCGHHQRGKKGENISNIPVYQNLWRILLSTIYLSIHHQRPWCGWVWRENKQRYCNLFHSEITFLPLGWCGEQSFLDNHFYCCPFLTFYKLYPVFYLITEKFYFIFTLLHLQTGSFY